MVSMHNCSHFPFLFALCFLILVKLATAGSIYNVVDYHAVGDGKTDNSEAFLKAWSDACADPNLPTFLIPSGNNMNFLIGKIIFQGPCKSYIHVQLAGTVTAPNRIWTNDMTKLITFANINGLRLDGMGTMDGQGAIWWDCFNRHTCNNRPYILGFEGCNDITVKDVHLKNSPNKHLTFNHCKNVRIDGITVTAPETSPNTDGIYLQNSQSVQIIGCVIGTGDDCIAIGTGSSDVNITKISCGPGHGISIGSLGGNGSNARVEQVHVSDCHIFQALTGVRIKTWPSGSGYARKITFERINITRVKTPIDVTQFYPQTAQVNAVAISNVAFNDIHGTSLHDIAILVECSARIPCRGLTFSNINLSKVGGGNVSSQSQNAYGQTIGTIIPTIHLSGR